MIEGESWRLCSCLDLHLFSYSRLILLLIHSTLQTTSLLSTRDNLIAIRYSGIGETELLARTVLVIRFPRAQAKLNPHFCLLSFSSHSFVMINLPTRLKHCPFASEESVVRIIHLFAIGSPHEVSPHDEQVISYCGPSRVSVE